MDFSQEWKCIGCGLEGTWEDSICFGCKTTCLSAFQRSLALRNSEYRANRKIVRDE